MKFVSTRGRAPAVGFSEAILAGLAPDGGLYVPEHWPRIDRSAFGSEARFDELATELLGPFLEGDPLERELGTICAAAFDFPLPLVPLERDTAVLELFHGPTAAFKDFGARFLAACLERLLGREPRAGAGAADLTILVATSGDTGAAVAAAFHHQARTRVGVLFPKGGVSRRQEHQLTCWDDNVHAFAVRGSFDDCQRMVKAAFSRPGWPRHGRLSSANSINVGRLLPQAAYYAVAGARYQRETGRTPGFVVPSGNLGNSVGAFWARRMGFPVRHVALATNSNRVVADWFESGAWRPRTTVRTLANAMDVGEPSNMERLLHLYEGEPEGLREQASALAVDDETIRRVIAAGPERWGRVWCPHTATAVRFREQLGTPDWIIVATAHPAKFDSIVEPLVGRPVPLPPGLAELLRRPTRVTEIGPGLEELLAHLDPQPA